MYVTNTVKYFDSAPHYSIDAVTLHVKSHPWVNIQMNCLPSDSLYCIRTNFLLVPANLCFGFVFWSKLSEVFSRARSSSVSI